MVDDIVGIFTLALIVGVIAVAIRNGGQTSAILNAGLSGFSGLERAALGN